MILAKELEKIKINNDMIKKKIFRESKM